MNLSLNVPTPLEYFSALVHADADFPLLEAAISLAQDEYPDLSVQQVLGDVDQLLARLNRRVPADAGPLQRLRTTVIGNREPAAIKILQRLKQRDGPATSVQRLLKPIGRCQCS